MASTTDRDSCVVFNTARFQEKIDNLTAPFVEKFTKINRRYVLFHAIFIGLMSIELIFFGLSFSRFLESTVMAFWLAGIFLTVFSYLVLLFYLQGRRPERLMQLRDDYMEDARVCIPFEQGSLEYHCCITEAIVGLISHLKIVNLKWRFVTSSETLTYLVEKLRIWTRWKDLLKIKEMLLLSSIQEHIRLIKQHPSDLQAHSSLASNYVALAEIYEDPKKLTLNEELIWEPPEYSSEKMDQKFQDALEHALEEYHIIDEYAPNDPWVHAQRAAIYKKLHYLEDEQREYEIILGMDSENVEILFRLGALYFRKGENAIGLKIYDKLQSLNPEKAQEIITHYDSYAVEEYSFD